MSCIVEARELSRWYGMVMGLNNVSFQIRRGITGLVGPNGAGKSTLIQLVIGQLQPSSGELRVLDEKPWNNPGLVRRIGYCPERESVPGNLPPAPWLRALALLSGYSSAEASERSRAMLDRVKLPREQWKKRLSQYSKGMKQRVKLAQALIHDPALLVLDEPMNGLDPMGRQEMAHLLKELASAGVSIIISSHILAELESLCHNILILSWGRVLASGNQGEIRADLKNWPEQLTIRCEEPAKLSRHLFDAGVLAGFQIDASQGLLHIHLADPRSFYDGSLDLLLGGGVQIFEIRSQNRSLQQIFERVTT